MKKVLHIISSVQGEASVSKKLGNAIIEKINTRHPDSIVKERNLTTNLFSTFGRCTNWFMVHFCRKPFT